MIDLFLKCWHRGSDRRRRDRGFERPRRQHRRSERRDRRDRRGGRPAGNTDALNDVLAGETDVAGDLAGKSDAPNGNTDALNDVPSKTAVQTDVAGIMTGRLRSSPLLTECV